MRARLVAGVAIAWLAVASPALAADRVVDRGIVQSVSPSALVLRGLDGVEVEVPLGPLTRFRLNGLPAPGIEHSGQNREPGDYRGEPDVAEVEPHQGQRTDQAKAGSCSPSLKVNARSHSGLHAEVDDTMRGG